MTSDDQLRDALRAEADAVEPSAAGYTQIKDKIARRRRLLVWQRSAVAAVAAMSVVAVAVVVFTGDDDKSQIGVTNPTPTAEESVEPSASPSPTGVPSTTDPVAAVWPFTSRAEIEAWTPAQYPALSDVRTAALGFVNDVLGRHDFTVGQPDDVEPSVAQVDVTRVDGNRTVTVSTVTLRNMGTDGPWVVLLATNDRLAITTPTGDAVVSSPLSAKGSITGVDEQVLVEVREAHIGRQPLGTGNFRGGSEGWAGTVPFSGGPGRGAVLAHTGSFLDGKPVTFAATPVRLAANTTPTASMPATFVAIRENRVALFATSTGAFQRYLTTEQPGGGVSHLAMAPDGTTVYFVRGQGTCAASINAVSTTNQTERTVESIGGRVYGDLTVSGDGKNLAYVTTNCEAENDVQALVVRDLASGTEKSWTSTASPPESGTITEVALNEDGSRLYFLHERQDNTVRIRELNTGSGGVLEDHTTTWAAVKVGGTIRHIAFSKRYGVTASSDWEGSQRVTNLRSNGGFTRTYFFAKVQSLDWDATGGAAIYYSALSGESAQLWRWSGDDPVEITSGRAVTPSW